MEIYKKIKQLTSIGWDKNEKFFGGKGSELLQELSISYLID